MQARSSDVGEPAPDEPFLLLVTGGRDYDNRSAVFAALDVVHRKHPNLTIIHGACPTGLDALAEGWAQDRERPSICVRAEWGKFGPSAGPRRNGRMLLYLPNGVAAFPGGAGTADMVQQAEKAGLAVWRVG